MILTKIVRTRIIGSCAFSNCKSLKSVIFIPKFVNGLGDFFDRCDSLKDIIIPPGTRAKFEELLPDYKDKLVEQEDENLSTEVTNEELANRTDSFKPNVR